MLFSLFEFSFMSQAFIIGILISVSAALLSPFLVLSNRSLVADGLSHVSFAGIVIGLLVMEQPIYIALIITVIASILMTILSEIKLINADASIGVVSAISMAIALIIISLSSGFQISIESYLKGNIFTVEKIEIIIAALIFMLITLFVFIYYRKLVSSTYDEMFASTKKVNTKLIKYLLSMLTALLIVIGVKTVGILLISAFVIFPSLISSQLSRNFRQTIIMSVVIAFLTINASLLLTNFIFVPPSSVPIVIYTLLLLIFISIRKIKYKE